MTTKAVPLRHLADVLVSNVDKKAESDGLPVRLVNYTDVYYHDQITSEMPLMAATATPDQLGRFGLRVGDSLITKDSETAGDIAVSAYVLNTAHDMVSGYHLAIVRPRPGTHPRFLAWALRSTFVRGQYAVRANGMTRYGLTYDAIESAEIPIPAEAAQLKIANFLDEQIGCIDKIIANRKSQIKLFEAESQAMLDSFFESNRGEVAPRLGRFVRRIEQGWSPQCEAVPAGPAEWGVTKVSAVRPGRFNADENKRLPDDLEPQREYEIKPNDLMVTRANTPTLVGAFAVAPTDVRRRLILCDKIMRVTLDPVLDPRYVALFGQSSRVRRTLSQAGTGTSQSMVNVRGSDIRDLRITLKSVDVQEVIIEKCHHRATRIADLTWQLAREVDLMSNLKASLITAAVTGEFDVSTADGSRVPV